MTLLSLLLSGGALVAYYLDEKRGWALDTADMKRAVDEARAEGKSVRGLVFINPGNPTGESGVSRVSEDLTQEYRMGEC